MAGEQDDHGASRQPGDMELRVLPDGRVVLLAPDEALLEVAALVEPGNAALRARVAGSGKGSADEQDR